MSESAMYFPSSIPQFHLSRLKGTMGRLTAHFPEKALLNFAKNLGDQSLYPNLDPHLRLLAAVHHRFGSGDLFQDDYHKSRQDFRKNTLSIVGVPTKVERVQDFKIKTSAGQVPVRLYRTSTHKLSTQSQALIIFFHGGGFIVGDLDTHDEACRLICKYAQASVLSVDYRLAPAAAIDDGWDVLTWVYNHAADLNIDDTKIAVAGDSAGGNIAAVLAQMAVNKGYTLAGQLLFYPGLDLQEIADYPSRKTCSKGLFITDQDIHAVRENYVYKGTYASNDPLLSPIIGNLKGVCPAVIVIPEYDVLRDENVAYCQKLSNEEVPCQQLLIRGQTHGFINYTSINKSAKQATILAAQAFGRLLSCNEYA